MIMHACLDVYRVIASGMCDEVPVANQEINKRGGPIRCAVLLHTAASSDIGDLQPLALTLWLVFISFNSSEMTVQPDRVFHRQVHPISGWSSPFTWFP